ncbi:unnamed protein product [Durusdinium trenchii]|uniref:Uncharacterized protein n=1 Tax=Durusdinium trenchii TaxID=1381693 RepID=A0ABP0N4T2_9DINO
MQLWVALLSGEKAALEVSTTSSVRSVRTLAQTALRRPLLGLARSDSPTEVPLPKDSTLDELQIPENSVLYALVGRLRVKSTRFAFAACQGDGSAVAWGSPFAGGDTSEVADQLAEDVQDVSANLMAFAAVKIDGSVVTWGHQSCGGQISTELKARLSGNNGVRKIVASHRAFAALKRDGSVVCWGCHFHGGQTPSLCCKDLSNIFSTTGAFAAVDSKGAVVTWGHAASGGDSTPVADQLQEGITQVCSNNSAFAALRRDGAVVAWGAPHAGGQPDLEALNSGVIKVFSTDAAFAVLRAGGEVVCWGDALFGGCKQARKEEKK